MMAGRSIRPAYSGPYPGKRAVDLGLLAVLGLPALVVGAACAVAVAVERNGPIFFRQVRMGKGGRPFTVLKFRTMLETPAPSPFPDPSLVTRTGRVLRRLSLDELPQLVNVARGEMSVVGPRPALGYQVERYDVHQRGRLAVRPGLTGLAQVRGRNALTWAERIEMDLEYVALQSARLDLQIVWWTVRTVLSGRGVEGHPLDDPLAMLERDDG